MTKWHLMKPEIRLERDTKTCNWHIGLSVGCLTIIVSLIVLGIPGFILVTSALKGSQVPLILNIIGIVILIVIFVVVNGLVRAVLVVFNYSNWNQIFELYLSGEEKEKSK